MHATSTVVLRCHLSHHPRCMPAGPQVSPQISGQLWHVLLRQQAWTYSPALQAPARSSLTQQAPEVLHALHAPAQSAMTQLAAACGLSHAAALTAMHAPALLTCMVQVGFCRLCVTTRVGVGSQNVMIWQPCCCNKQHCTAAL